MTRKLALLLIATMALVGCKETVSSNDVIPDARDGNNRIYRSYRYVHNEYTNKTHMTAHFSVGRGGDYVRLDYPASFAVNGHVPYANTDHNDGQLDGSDVAYFYLGFISPIFWLGLVDIDRGAYYSEMYRNTSNFQMEWVDQLGRSYYDSINRPNFTTQELPRDFNPAKDYFISFRSASDMSSTITLRFESQNKRLLEPECTDETYTVTIRDPDTGVEREEERTRTNCIYHYKKSVSFYSRNGLIKVDAEKLKELPYGDVKISISGRFEKTLPRDKNEGGDVTFHVVKEGTRGYIERTDDNQGKE